MIRQTSTIARRTPVLASLLVILFGIGCAAHAQESTATRPSVALIVPDTVVAGPVVVQFRLSNYGIAPAGVVVAGTGHFHVLVDTDPPAVGEVIPVSTRIVHLGGGQIEGVVDLAPGPHVLRAVLGDAQHRVISTDLISPPVTVYAIGPRGRP